MRKLIKFSLVLLWLFLMGLSICLSGNAQSPQARYILALSDVDMVATAYIDGNLGATVKQPDTLSIIPVPFTNGDKTTTIEASNSVSSPPVVMDVTPDSKLALVIETWQPRPQRATKLDELIPGKTLRGFDVSDPNNPQFIGAVEVNTQPQAIAINPDGSLAAIAGLEIDEGLTFVGLDGGSLGQPQKFSLNLPARRDLQTDGATFIEWHPSGRFLAVNLVDRAQVAFYEVVSKNGVVTDLRPYGNIVQVNKYPLTGCFTPDGKYYITSDLQWGADVPGFFGVNRGTLTTIRVAAPEKEGDYQNFAIAVTEGGLASETIAVSPDGQLLATSNMRNTGQLKSSLIYDPEASLNLYRIDSTSGVLTKLGEWKYQATLPQGLVFDPSGNYIYVGVNAYNDDHPLQGGVEVWQVIKGKNPQLKRTNTIVRAPRGIHSLAAIK
jgi:DNA-binding beta-propeller fold protein YncE